MFSRQYLFISSIRQILGFFVFLVIAILCLKDAIPAIAAEKGQAVAKNALIRVADFGAVGDGIHDDGPAITAAFEAAKADGISSTVIFRKKSIGSVITRRLGIISKC